MSKGADSIDGLHAAARSVIWHTRATRIDLFETACNADTASTPDGT
jgi:hypothetical protein